MNIEAYISSGILEAYASGLLNAAEREEVERMLVLYPILQEELAKIEETQIWFLQQVAIQPDESVKNAILDQTKRSIQAKSTIKSAQPYFWAVAASISIALISSLLSVYFYFKWQGSEKSLAKLIAQNQQLAQDYTIVNQKIDQLENDLSVLYNPNTERIILTGTPNAPDAQASVFWNKEKEEIYLQLQNLQAIAQDQQFQLWAIIDGQPVDAGVFDFSKDALLKMKPLPGNISTFAITIEPRGGKPSPTLETMQAAGNTAKS
ncbi:MAG: anti-sigma factor [Cyclobacteriaceae bacterium]|nr:anti-sigma factor [Cyclobacteriaceae bacterium]